jgi:hypothetical protein
MLYPLVMQTFDFEINRNVEMMLSFFSAYMVQRRPIRSQVQTLMYGIYTIKFWIFYAFAFCYPTGSSTHSQHYNHHHYQLPAYANVACPVNKSHVAGDVKNPTYIFSSSLGEDNTFLFKEIGTMTILLNVISLLCFL